MDISFQKLVKKEDDGLKLMTNNYIINYIIIKKIDGKINILKIHKNKEEDNMIKLLLLIMNVIDDYENLEIAKVLSNYIYKINHNDFSNMINNINY